MQNAFRSSRLIYRAIEFPDDDAYWMSKNADSQALANMYPGLLKPPSKDAIEGVKKWLESCLLAVMICLPADPAVPGSKPIPIGDMTLMGSPPAFVHHRRSEIGIGLIAKYRGQGYGSEAIEWILEYGFQVAGLHRIGIGAFGWNEGAWKLYERLGFTPEGIKRDFLWYNGGWHNLHELAMLEHDWRARRDEKKVKAESTLENPERG